MKRLDGIYAPRNQIVWFPKSKVYKSYDNSGKIESIMSQTTFTNALKPVTIFTTYSGQGKLLTYKINS